MMEARLGFASGGADPVGNGERSWSKHGIRHENLLRLHTQLRESVQELKPSVRNQTVRTDVGEVTLKLVQNNAVKAKARR